MGLDLTLSEKATKELKYLLKLKKLDDNFGVRIGVRGGGCSGYTYNLEFGLQHKGDVKMEKNGILVFTDPKSVLYINGTTLNYTDGLQGKGFHFDNANATSTCGCGESFGT